jgi:hypothetical protein
MVTPQTAFSTFNRRVQAEFLIAEITDATLSVGAAARRQVFMRRKLR